MFAQAMNVLNMQWSFDIVQDNLVDNESQVWVFFLLDGGLKIDRSCIARVWR